MIWWFVRWILYGQRQRPFIGSGIKSGSSQWYWSLSDATLFWQRQGERKRQLLERYASDVGDDEILDLTLIRLWWFWPVVRFMSVSHAFLIQRCGCILGVQMRQMIFSLTYSLWKRNSSLSWVQTVFLPGVVVGNVLLTDLPIYNHQKWTFFKDVFFPI